MTSPIFALADEYITAYARLHPMFAGSVGIKGDFGVATDFGPEAVEERAELDRDTLAKLNALASTGPADDLARLHMAERLSVSVAQHEAGEWRRALRVPYGMLQSLVGYVDLAPRRTENDWRLTVSRMRAIPEMLATWRQTLNAGIEAGQTVARLQVSEGVKQARRNAGTRVFDKHVQAYGDGPQARDLREAAEAAYGAFNGIADYLEGTYAPHAAERDGVGEERYLLAARSTLGAVLDPRDAYDWAWDELHRIEDEMAAEADKIVPGAGLDEVIAHLDATQAVGTHEEYLAWLTEKHQGALEALNGVHFDIDPRLMNLDVEVVHGSSAGSAYYTGPSEDLSRPGRTWWPVAERETFRIWGELTTVFHEGVPGHHLQIGQTKVTGDGLSRFAKVFGSVSGHAEGWALYAERLSDELGWFADTGSRLGMLKGSALRAARVVIDIGWHLDLPLPAAEAKLHGERWNFDTALEVLKTRGRIAEHRAYPEIVRYAGWPGQAICYKLGERAWVDARAEAQAAAGADFDLKAWHTRALNLGPIGLDNLATVLRG
ncbi:DUF885 domain-containing protein [Glycomyces algeriensis]|uniref:DUF885 domain-containing protein n=1 Tax=Glycomyces algeriensis TaxID=256037 RepID=A0A9W6G4T5_9ACTN|nr:DUF885 domain-containing protein [Glycomyces algeriensis]MDA1366909.1 DUF885 domain-containing protein [Glycomyces algeriensis]MDR7352705.1 uncharacterized protein (DUF885 family) [Glycomyces algeriensis]GLI40387.1 hypothetical protein GALLR39Z86_02370 [Glycomyces algeriensis]